jgi:hypothetical protein
MAQLHVVGYGQAEGEIVCFTVMSKLVVGNRGVFLWITTAEHEPDHSLPTSDWVWNAWRLIPAPPPTWGYVKYKGNLIHIFTYVIYGGPLMVVFVQL